jgi:aspartyl-tRNA(Asn)/glutamyl-tRNA(Gln) amidotransferase subunit A
MTNEIIFSDATKLAELIRTKEVSPVEVCRRTWIASRP